MFTHNYAFGAYRKLASELNTAVSKVQSEKLAVLLSDAAASIDKLIVVVEQKEQLLKSRTQAHFGVLKAWAGDIVVAGPTPHLYGDCSDQNPKHWAEECPRCLACHIFFLDRTAPYTAEHWRKLLADPTPNKRRKKAASFEIDKISTANVG